jgi:hypothetical protein
MTYIPSDVPSHTKNKNIYGVGVGISMVFKILGYMYRSPVSEERDHPV